ncbi:LSM domain containing protein, putative [Angomonas deanei]|uniref:LSM domain containing protein, putative n=1 Tax=Angomonas deanei TaxID=59799 RepID=A0A7G2CK55_9TRYP|nr:LSM domain containing protein, putative [Angomonas deanei]
MPPKNKAKAAQEEAAAPLEPFLGRELRVELTDGRVIVGVLLAYEGSGNLMLQGAVMQCQYKNNDVVLNTNEKEITLRTSNMMAVPFRYVKSMQRRKEGNTMVIQKLEDMYKTEHEARVAAKEAADRAAAAAPAA